MPSKSSATSNAVHVVPKEGDVVILVMGLTGSGKSSFINSVTGASSMTVGFDMESCTTSILTAEVDNSIFHGIDRLKDCRLILVDTPSLDDTYIHGLTVLKTIGKWLGDSHSKNVVLGGLIYLHDISIDRFSGSASKSLIVFNRLCGQDCLQNVAIVVTKSDRLLPEEVKKREDRIKNVHWKHMINHGAQCFRVNAGDSNQARQIVSAVLERLQREDTPILDVQRDLLDGKSIRQTRAWETAKEYFSTWRSARRRRAHKHVPNRLRSSQADKNF